MKRKNVYLPICDLPTTRAVSEKNMKRFEKMAKIQNIPIGQYICMLINHELYNKRFLLEGNE